MLEISNTPSVSLQNNNLGTRFVYQIFGTQNRHVAGQYPQTQNWSILDYGWPFEERLSAQVEKVLDDIDSGKEKLTRYYTVDSYLKHVKDVLEE